MDAALGKPEKSVSDRGGAGGIDETDLMYFGRSADADEPCRLLASLLLLLSARPPQRSPFPHVALSAQLPTGPASRPTFRPSAPGSRSIGGNTWLRKIGPVRSVYNDRLSDAFK